MVNRATRTGSKPVAQRYTVRRRIGDLVLSRHQPFSRLAGLVRREHTPLLVASLSLVSTALVWLDGPMVLRVPLGILAVLFLPGYSLALFLLPGAFDVDGIERKALSLGLSFGLILVMSLALDNTTWGLRPTPMVLSLAGFTLLVSGLAWWRMRSKSAEHAAISADHSSWHPPGHITKLMVSFLVVSVLLVISGLVFTLASQPTPLTEFFILGSDGQAKEYPQASRSGDALTIEVGITNREIETMTYSIVIQAGGENLSRLGPIQVTAGSTWQQPVTFVLPRSGKENEINIKLFREDRSEPYRSLRLSVDILAREGTR